MILARLDLTWADLFPDAPARSGATGRPLPSSADAGVQAAAGCTLIEYARAKRLPQDFLHSVGVSEISYQGRPALRIPYLDAEGKEIAVRFRTSLDGADRFRWKRGSQLHPYGLWRLEQAPAMAYVVLVEGESDAQTLWLHDEPALGLPGAASWQEEWADCLSRIPLVYVVIEPDDGGESLLRKVSGSVIADRLRLVRLVGAKDPSALYIAEPDRFRERWAETLASASGWSSEASAAAKLRERDLWQQCSALALEPAILDRFGVVLSSAGVAGEERVGKLLYLIVTARLLDRPVSAAVKGPSSAGKSYLVAKVLEFFPPEAAFALSAMSEKALAYSREPLAHRVLVVYEAAGLRSEFASYLIRSLLSEGHLRYETVERTARGLVPKLIEREGPTALVVTTTAVRLHDENETRLLSIPVTDTPEHTRAVLRQVAKHGAGPAIDVTAWHALQAWLTLNRHPVVVPYAEVLADMVPPVAVRLRRDFPAVLALIRAHALLHQAQRGRNGAGAVVATVEDYSAVRELVGDLIADGLHTTVPPTVRETVDALRRLHDTTLTEVTVVALARYLNIDDSSALRRAKVAINAGHLENHESRRNRPAKLVPGEPLPDDVPILPTAVAVAERWACTAAVETPGDDRPPSLSEPAQQPERRDPADEPTEELR